MPKKSERRLQRATLSHFKAHGRHALPWRTKQTPYRVVVSEVMLQQTQVERVVPKFNAFVARFPHWQSLASASLPEVYALWSGLGYNRRAKYLRDAARMVVNTGGVIANDKEALQALPGIGPYTAGAIRAFVFGNNEPFVETNIRTAVMHHCFPGARIIDDKEIVAVLTRLLPRRGQRARDWYAALMDYGAHLKRQGIQLNPRASTYAKQSAFNGSLRQLRGAIVRALAKESLRERMLVVHTARSVADVRRALASLVRDGLVAKDRTVYRLAK